MGVAGVVAGHGAKLPAPLLAWASTLMIAALLASLAALIVSALMGSARSAYRIGVVSTAAVLVAMLPTGASASRAGLAQPPAVGSALSSRIGAFVLR